MPRMCMDESILPIGIAKQMEYSERDKDQLVQAKADIQKNKSGHKRGRKSQQFSSYCEQTTQRIKDLKAQIMDPDTTDEERSRLRNQISAYQARLKQRINCLDSKVKLEKMDTFTSGIIQIFTETLEPQLMSKLLTKINE